MGDYFPVSENDLFIGQTSTYPVVGKLFVNKTEYLSVAKEITEAVEFLGLSNQSKKSTAILVLKGNIEVDIVEREDCIFMSVWFKGKPDKAGFSGLTDTKGIGYAKIIEKYKKKFPIVLSLMCNETKEETLIFGVKNVGLTTL
ncbi:hypothetical protein PASE110613_14975 [Paenibacillus sediminis]|uniref:Uncharacterized protein n=1 Tax=Paenibacillus sediminis TaxID=664909 RepID=A0ABS4H613_9BACL|nr:hypothetical protein [Paenibacillus sediminis]MBP1937983.1 hypothetical protein [Paenibacillus sediminis]